MAKPLSEYIRTATNKEEEKILAMQEAAKGPIPPLRDIKNSKSYWLVFVDSDDRIWEAKPYQWQPSAKRWCHVGEYATGQNLDLRGYVIIAEVVLPEIPAMTITRNKITVHQN